MNEWHLLVTSLPTENATARMRTWRALKASGAAVLRDGVYLLPARPSCRATLATIAEEVRAAGGIAHELSVGDSAGFAALFDRSDDWATLLAAIDDLYVTLSAGSAAEAQKQVRRLRKTQTTLAAIDFFAGAAGQQVTARLSDLETAIARALSPDEPQAHAGSIKRLKLADYQGRLWATRRRPWVDRLASAWLIRRHIDADARLLWLENPADCPAKALGFDFDGARFSHVGARVTFEVLLASFGLEQTALSRLGALVHFLDVGGVEPAEACGVERALAGLRTSIADDDQLLAAASAVFDGLLAAFGNPENPP